MSEKIQPIEDLKIETLNEDMGYFHRVGKKLHETRTKFQDLEIYETSRFGRIMRLDGVFQTSEKDEFLYHEPLSHVPGITIDGPETALVIGGGDGGAAEEILKYPTIKKVVMVELDGGVTEAAKEYLHGIHKGAFDSERFELLITDGLEYVRNTKEKFDQVFIDLTDPFGPSIELYTKQFYQSINNLLTDRGVIALHIESPITRPQLFGRLHATLKSVFGIVRPMLNYVPMYGTLWGFAVASNKLDPMALTKTQIKERIAKHKLSHLQFYNEDTHFSLMALPNYVQDILRAETPIINSGDSLPEPAGSRRNLVIAEKEK